MWTNMESAMLRIYMNSALEGTPMSGGEGKEGGWESSAKIAS